MRIVLLVSACLYAHAEYYWADPGVFDCDSGDDHVDEQHCKLANDILCDAASKTPQRVNLQSNSGRAAGGYDSAYDKDYWWSLVMPGCSSQTGGDYAAHFNHLGADMANMPSIAQRQHFLDNYQIICAAAPDSAPTPTQQPTPPTQQPTPGTNTNLLLGRVVNVSTTMQGASESVTDGDGTTYWRSQYRASNEVEVTLGQPANVGLVRLQKQYHWYWPAGVPVGNAVVSGKDQNGILHPCGAPLVGAVNPGEQTSNSEDYWKEVTCPEDKVFTSIVVTLENLSLSVAELEAYSPERNSGPTPTPKPSLPSSPTPQPTPQPTSSPTPNCKTYNSGILNCGIDWTWLQSNKDEYYAAVIDAGGNQKCCKDTWKQICCFTQNM